VKYTVILLKSPHLSAGFLLDYFFDKLLLPGWRYVEIGIKNNCFPGVEKDKKSAERLIPVSAFFNYIPYKKDI
jgi:hypothetical protein